MQTKKMERVMGMGKDQLQPLLYKIRNSTLFDIMHKGKYVNAELTSSTWGSWHSLFPIPPRGVHAHQRACYIEANARDDLPS
jgi:hypothetical protein